MKLKIKITKEVLKRSMMCGLVKATGDTAENCAIAVAVRDIFPKAWVGNLAIHPKGRLVSVDPILLPKKAVNFIYEFDNLTTPKKRLDLPEFSFEIDLPDEVIESIDISDLENHETLKLIEV